tara:strand:- start:110 stop:784 length:675 start_codon:yes stop_codon:yes gene_type:complete
MPVSIPNTFSSAANVLASSVKQNNETLRSYLNGSVAAADIDAGSVSSSALVRGTYISPNASHWFSTGDIFGSSKGGQSWERTYFTGQGKQIEDYTTVTQYIPISGTGASLVLEHDATVFIHGYYQIVVPEGSLNGNTVGKDHIAYYIINSAVPSSYALAFTEGGTASANSGAVQGETPNNRRSFPIAYIDDLTAGTHELYLAVNLDEAAGYVSAYSFYIETLYR